jgi:hypothetical protein
MLICCKNLPSFCKIIITAGTKKTAMQEKNLAYLQQFEGQYEGTQAVQEHVHCHHHYRQIHLNEESGT